ncbi:MAG: DinB family protein [Gemmatimonadetes bacterium]|nr:DinB family protein [Gemmatimonadota bacterium]
MNALLNATAAQCRYQLQTLDQLTAGIDDAALAREPAPGLKTAGWLVGHLAVTGDFGRKLCGRPPMCPKEWRAMFNPGTQPSHDAASYPPAATLVATMRAVYDDLSRAAPALDDAIAAGPNPFAPAAHALPTVADFVGYLMSGHLLWHLGQLYSWRKADAARR